MNCTASKKRTEIWTIDFFWKNFNLKKQFSSKKDSSVPIGWSLRFLRSLRSLCWLETVNPA